MRRYGLAKCNRLSDGKRVDLPAAVELPPDASTEAFVQATEAFAAERGLYLIAWFPWSEAQYLQRLQERPAEDLTQT